MQSLVKLANIYIVEKKQKNATANHSLISCVAKYLTRMLKVFGANDGEQEIGFPMSGADSSANVSEQSLSIRCCRRGENKKVVFTVETRIKEPEL